jgi:predicted protein tyrosine phosphatase
MTIWISSLASAPALARQHRPALIVSLLSPWDAFPEFDDHAADRHLRVAVHDIVEDIGDQTAPTAADAERLVRFVETWDLSAPLLVHCWAGISRSTATAFIAACLHNPEADEAAIARAIRAASPTASPNRRIVALADAMLGRKGRMSRAVDAIGRGALASEAVAFSLPSRWPAGPAP